MYQDSDYATGNRDMDTGQIPFIRIEPANDAVITGIVSIPGLLEGLLSGISVDEYAVRKAEFFSEDNFREQFLCDAELARINSFKSLKKQLEWLSGRYAVKKLASYSLSLDVPLQKIEIAYARNGIPFLNLAPVLSISLSHSGDYAMAGISIDLHQTIGLDIEKVQSSVSTEFMKVAFTDKEIFYLKSKSAQEIFIHWTIKEAFLKLIGKGFHETLKSLEYTDGLLRYKKRVLQGITIHSHVMDDSYAVTVLSLIRGLSNNVISL